MDDTLLFIPPCCVNKMLPKAMKEAPRRMLSFYTHGDVTAEKFYRAISYEMISRHVLVLAIPVVSNEMLAFLAQCFERDWISHLILSTGRNIDDMMDKYLKDYKDKILYTSNGDVSSVAAHMVLYNNDRALILQGHMTERPSGRLSGYTLMFYPDYSLSINDLDWGNPIRNILFPDVLRHRQRVHKDKRRVNEAELSAFLRADFPPYKNKEDEDSSHDHHNFGNIY